MHAVSGKTLLWPTKSRDHLKSLRVPFFFFFFLTAPGTEISETKEMHTAKKGQFKLNPYL